MDHLRVVDADQLVEVAHQDTDSILLATFDPPCEVEDLQRLVAELSETGVEGSQVDVRAVTYTPEVVDSTALSLDGLASHTDGAFLEKPPPRFVLSCRVADEGGGGVSTFIPVDQIVEAAPPWVVESLSTTDFRFLKTYDGNLEESFVGPVLSRDQTGTWLIRWRADHIYRPQAVGRADRRGAEAALWLHEHVDNAAPISHSLAAGELALIPNGRFLHGRTALSRESRRCILRAWVF